MLTNNPCTGIYIYIYTRPHVPYRQAYVNCLNGTKARSTNLSELNYAKQTVHLKQLNVPHGHNTIACNLRSAVNGLAYTSVYQLIIYDDNSSDIHVVHLNKKTIVYH